VDAYKLKLVKNKKTLTLKITAYDSCHAQAQAIDIQRALEADAYDLNYGISANSILSDVFKQLALNEFSCDNCCEWTEKTCNNTPCIYVFTKRVYLKPLILKYLDIPQGLNVKLKCNNAKCINPYHFVYMDGKNSKLSGGDIKLLLAYRSQGVRVSQVAKALNVHRATIYRKLKNERFFAGFADHR